MRILDKNDQFCAVQRRDTEELVPYFISLMNWKIPNSKILNFGCGSGFNTKNVLLPSLPPGSKIWGLDTSKEIADYASANYSHPAIKYISSDFLNENPELKFDKIFSMMVLNWVPDQEQVFKQLFNLLNPNGEIGFYFVTTNPIYSTWESMSQNLKWTAYQSDAKKFIPESHFTSDPAADLRELLESIGYKVQESTNLPRSYLFDSKEELLDNALSVTGFCSRIPPYMLNEYKSDFWSTFTAHSHKCNNFNMLRFPYKLAVVRISRK